MKVREYPALYIRREPTDDPYNLGIKLDCVLYRDRDCTQFYCRIPWHYKRPSVRRTTISLNCVRWALTWLPPRKAGAP